MKAPKNCIYKKRPGGSKPILSLKDWKKWGGPKASENHWKAGRSAMECARAWLGTGPYADVMPPEVLEVFKGHKDFSSILEWQAEPEMKLRFDNYRGEPRNTDLAVEAKDKKGMFFIAVEAKADEPFDVTLVKALKRAKSAKAKNERSKALDRIRNLAKTILGRTPEQAGQIHYQLLTATAGALAKAKEIGAKRVVLLIHEFLTDETADRKHADNKAALNTFVSSLLGDFQAVGEGELIGPIRLPKQPDSPDWADGDLYIGKVCRYLRKRKVN